jgi:hypothetical protein
LKLQLSRDFIIDSDASPWNIEGIRIALFGGPGSGKSWTSALLVEQWLDQGGTTVIFEPRAEYQTLKERYDLVVFGGPYGKDMDFLPVTPKTYAKAVVEDGVSMIFYTSDVDEEDKLINFVSAFFKHLLKLQEIHKRPLLLVIEESQEYAPRTTKGRTAPPWIFSKMIKAFRDCFLQGRKLNVSTIAVSPRPQDIDFGIRQLANLTLYGKFSRQDIGYIDRECFQPYRQKSEHTPAQIYKAHDLIDLPTAKWLLISGKEARYIEVTEPRKTRHGAETPKLTYIAPRKQKTQKSIESLAKSLKTAIEEEQTEGSELDKEKRKTRKLDEELTETKKRVQTLETALTVAGAIKIETSQGTQEVSQEEMEKKISEVLKANWSEHLTHLKADIIEVLSKYQITLPLPHPIDTPSPVFEHETDRSLYQIWEPKMPGLCAKRIFRFLLDKKGAKYTKAQIGVNLGYKTSSGTFNGAIGFLIQNTLIHHDGQHLWVASDA